MKTTSTTRKPESERARKTRENQEKKLAHVHDLIKRANASEIIARHELIMILSRAITYHEFGKIEGLHSLDTACSNNDFCPRMQAVEDPSFICKYCYTRNMWDAAKFAHHITGEILSQVELTKEEAALVSLAALLLRINSDGELINHTHAVNVIRIIAAHPLTTGAVWTKRPAILDKAIKQEGKPDNMICGVSSPMINTPFRESWSWVDFIFTVYTPRGMVEALARGEHECNGKKCMACNFFCYRKHNDHKGPIYIAEAIRRPNMINSKNWLATLAAIDAATLDRQPAEA